MRANLTVNKLFIHSETNNKSFYTDFGDRLNVIYGANTSGKSTLIQLILFAFGINDNKDKLVNILSENIFVRLDFKVTKNDEQLLYTFIRKDETIYIKDQKSLKVTVFSGISGNTSAEHIKLKAFFNKLLDFNLMLETKAGINTAPIEVIFLPYYVSQDVGWVYLRKSFTGLDFYKNFKEDFLDYYLGVLTLEDRAKRKEIENELSECKQKQHFYQNFESTSSEIESAKLLDDSFKGKGNEFIDHLTSKKASLLNEENKFVKLTNQLAYNKQRLSVLSKVSRNHKHQIPGEGNCPICRQVLPSSTESLFEYYQNENDSLTTKQKMLEENKKVQSELNSLSKKIEILRNELTNDYKKLIVYSSNDITLDDWIKTQANIKLENSIIENIGKLAIRITELKKSLQQFKDDDDIEAERLDKNRTFKKYYNQNNIQLGVQRLEDNRFNYVYELSSFPFQGVQLHLAVLSYHFAFNRIVDSTPNVHRLPLILDSIFKEDLDSVNKENILKFICNNKPTDTQTIVSVADNKLKDPKIDYYNNKFFDSTTKLICVGNSIDKESILSQHHSDLDPLLNDSYSIMEYV
ncbi:hypothetical protein [Hymenobacter koreensis]|uniref:Rad50/SbcC-type AAA domain-containing protein n=1 Tax=Hymenobacter koreensis TaxID=1084523 RepID=A0ABP8JP93_9BACT